MNRNTISPIVLDELGVQAQVPAARVDSKWHVLLATWLGELFDGMDASIFVLVMFPAVSELLGTKSHSTVGQFASYILAIFMVGWAVGAVVFGLLADRIGRTKTMIITILLYACSTGLCALSHNWWELAGYRFLVGCGIGGEISIGAVMVSEYWRGNGRLHAAGVLTSSFGCGYLIAALLNFWLGTIGWRYLFIAGVAPALVTLYIRSSLHEPEHFTLVQELRTRLKKVNREELNGAQKNLLKNPLFELFSPQYRSRVLLVMALASAAIVGYWAVLAWIPAWINQLTGTAAVAERSQTAVVMNLGAIIGSLAGGWVMTKLNTRTAFFFAFLGSLLACVGMFMTVKCFGPILLAWVFCAGAFVLLPFVFLFIYVPELFPVNIRSTAFGLSVQVGRIAAACASLAAGQIIANFNGSYAIAGSSVAMIYVVGMLAALFLPKSSGQVESGVNLNELCQTTSAS
jgi:MFS family permease